MIQSRSKFEFQTVGRSKLLSKIVTAHDKLIQTSWKMNQLDVRLLIIRIGIHFVMQKIERANGINLFKSLV